jgi:hypothetical protein
MSHQPCRGKRLKEARTKVAQKRTKSRYTGADPRTGVQRQTHDSVESGRLTVEKRCPRSSLALNACRQLCRKERRARRLIVSRVETDPDAGSEQALLQSAPPALPLGSMAPLVTLSVQPSKSEHNISTCT